MGARLFLLVLTGVCLGSCGKSSKLAAPELIGTWTAESESLKVTGHADEVKPHPPNELTMEFKQDGTFVTVDRSESDPVTMYGKFEVLPGNKIKESVTDATGPGKFVKQMAGRTVTMDYSLSGNRLTLEVRTPGPDGKEMSRIEVALVRFH